MKRSSQPEPGEIERLRSLLKEAQESERHAYNEYGKENELRLAAESALAKASADIAVLEKERDELRAEIESYDSGRTLVRANARIAEVEAELRAAAADLEKSNVEIASVRASIAETIAELEASPSPGLIQAAEWHEEQSEINAFTETEAEACGAPDRVQKHHRDLSQFHKECAGVLRSLSSAGKKGQS